MHRIRMVEDMLADKVDPMQALSDVEVRLLQPGEMHHVGDILREVWGDAVVVPVHQLVAFIRNGGMVLGAFAGKEILGFCYGYPGHSGGSSYLVSQATAVLPTARRRGVASQLKWAQYRWAAEHGWSEIRWTFDPLESTNAYFNLCHLGAVARMYVPDYYGSMPDRINSGLPSDRLVVQWSVDPAHTPTGPLGATHDHGGDGGLPGKVGISPRDRPVNAGKAPRALDAARPDGANPDAAGPVAPGEPDLSLPDPTIAIAAPRDFQSLKAADPERAHQWRMQTRAVFLHYLPRGYEAVKVVRDPDGRGDIDLYVLYCPTP